MTQIYCLNPRVVPRKFVGGTAWDVAQDKPRRMPEAVCVGVQCDQFRVHPHLARTCQPRRSVPNARTPLAPGGHPPMCRDTPSSVTVLFSTICRESMWKHGAALAWRDSTLIKCNYFGPKQGLIITFPR